MAFTGRFGNAASQFGGIEFGLDLTDDLTRTVSHVLSLTDQAEGFLSAQEVSHVLNLALATHLVYDRTATAILSIVDAASATRFHFETVPDTLSLLDEGSGAKALEFSIDHALGLTDEALANIKNANAANVIELTQEARSNFKYATVADPLALVQSEEHAGPVYVTVAQLLNLAQSAVGSVPIVTVSVTHSLAMTQAVGRVRAVTVAQTINLQQTGQRFVGGTDALAIVQTVSAGKGGNFAQALGVSDSFTYTAFFGRSLEHLLGLRQAVGYTLVRSSTPCEYSPFVGTNVNPEFAAPSTVAPVIGDATLTLTYPFVAPTNTLVLRNPDFGNRDRLNFTRVNRQTRGGTLIVFASATWPKVQSLQVTVEFLKQQRVDDLLDFFALSLGQEIGLLDHENRQWRGIITTPDADVSHIGRENRSVTFEFEGELV